MRRIGRDVFGGMNRYVVERALGIDGVVTEGRRGFGEPFVGGRMFGDELVRLCSHVLVFFG